MDSATSFSTARFLKDMSAQNAWNTLHTCWINIYQRSSDYIIYNTDKNFTATEFKQLVLLILIKIKEILIKAYNSIKLVEQYHAPLHCIYKIFREELKNEYVNREMILQMTVKAVNDLAGPDEIVLILLVFKSYLRMTEMDLLSSSIVKRARAIHTATKKVHWLHAEH